MLIRPYAEQDLDKLRAIHAAQGFAYPFPDLTNPLFMTRLVLVDDHAGREEASEKNWWPQGAQAGTQQSESVCAPAGKILGAALLRLTAEAYLLLDPNAGSPRDRWCSLLQLHAATACEALHRGLEDVHAWLPPQIAAKFGKRLLRLGWVRDDAWAPYCQRLSG